MQACHVPQTKDNLIKISNEIKILLADETEVVL